jgi:hypothetical protein
LKRQPAQGFLFWLQHIGYNTTLNREPASFAKRSYAGGVMKIKEKDSTSASELQLELKYCERCGGLWLRPVAGGQIYCVACGREMNKLPVARRETGSAEMPQGALWDGDDGGFGSYDEGDESDLAGGAA